MRKIAFLACVVVLAACAPKGPQWHKPGATPENAAAELQACRAAAPLEPRKPLGPPTKMGAGGSFDAAFERRSEEMRKDERHVAECMRAKGYTDAR